VRLRGVSLFVYAVQPDGVLQFSQRIEADEARLEPGFWRLSGVRVAMPGAGAIRSETYTMPSNLDDRTASERFNNPQAIAVWRLPETIKRTEAAGFSSIPFRCGCSRCWPRRCCSRRCRCWRPPSRCG
jgi:lipopolysaccharide export system permease protein